jgi:hypothetical protein
MVGAGAGVDAEQAYMWVSGMIGLFTTLRPARLGGLDDALAEAMQRVAVSPKVSPEKE